MAQPRSRFPAYPPDLPEGLQLYLEAIRKEISTLGVSGGASIRIEESDAVVSTSANVIDFFGADFDVTQSPVGEANVAISSGIARTGHVHDAADITTGSFSRARLPAQVAYEDEANTFSLTQTFSVQLVSSVTTGTAPFSVASTTVVTNLNADLLDGQTGTFYTDLANATGNLAYARLPTGGGTWANGGTLSITGGVTTVAGLTSSADITAQARLLLTTAASKIVPGATSLALRNNADSADNAIWTNAGDATFRTKLTMPGPLVLTTAASTIVPGATSLALRNTADNANNLLLTDAGVATLRNDLIIGTLGTFDSADTPLEGQLLVYHAGGTAKWQAETFITVYAQGDSKVELLTDGSLTAAAYILRDPGTAGAAAPPNDPTVPIVSVDHLAHTLEIRSYVKTANFRYFEWQYCTGAACTGWVALVLSTSTKIVHSRLTDGTVYRYRVRAVGRDGDLTSFFTTGDNTATANSESMAFGTIIAAEIAVANLSAISADFGIITAGIARNTGNTAGINFGGAGGIPGTWTSGINFESAAGSGSMTRYINFTATGSNPVIKHEQMSLNADGTADFSGTVSATIFTAVLAFFSGGIQMGPSADDSVGTIIAANSAAIRIGKINATANYWDLAHNNTTTGKELLISHNTGGGIVTLIGDTAGLGARIRLETLLEFTPAATKIVPGATSLALRNNANSADNLLIADAGKVTFRNNTNRFSIDDASTNTAGVAGVVVSTSAASGDYPEGTIWCKV